MLARLGAEAADAIDEFLNLALAYDDGAAPSLQGFLSWLREGTRVIKRDMEQGRDEVRVMTVHGAKGLEAPIVFLPDTCSTRSGRRPGSLLKLDGAERPSDAPAPFLWPVKGTSDLAVVQQAKAAVARAEAEERNRLLYVALTRARDRLYVAGFEGRNAPPPDCWYNLIRDGLGDQLQEVAATDGRVVWRLASAQTAKPEPATARRRGFDCREPAAGLGQGARAAGAADPRPAGAVAAGAARDRCGRRAGRAASRPTRRAADPAAVSAGRRRPLPARHADARAARASADPAEERWAAAAEAFVASGGRAAAGQRAQEHRRGDAGGAARAGVRAAVRARRAAPRWRSSPRCPTPEARAGPAACRQDRPPGAGREHRS